MKLFFALLLIIYSYNTYGQNKAEIKDSVGIFLTQEDFLNNQISNVSREPPTYNWIFGVSVLLDIYSNYSIYGKIRFEMPDGTWKTFKRGEIFGFYVNGQKYVYIKEFKEYLTVVNDNPVWFYLETGSAPRFSINPVKKLYYARFLGEEPKRFNKNNIIKDFGADNDTTIELINILDKLPDNFISGQEEEYKNYVKIINDH